MNRAIQPLVIGNWKMNGRLASVAELRSLKASIAAAGRVSADIMICPPAPYLYPYRQELEESGILLGAQDCHPGEDGAHTGDISAEMLKDVGCRAVIVGHSERRTDHGEDDSVVKKKAEAAHRAGLAAIICIGETEQERERGETLSVLERQLQRSVPDGANATGTVIAYEPVWAIGTGQTPTREEVADAHAFIRRILVSRFEDAGEAIQILYGGSVKPANAADLLAVPDVNGALVGGASLKAEDFWAIVRAAPEQKT